MPVRTAHLKKSTRMEVFVFQSRGSIIMFMKQKICGKPINASRLLAKAFVKHDLQDDEVVIVDGKLKLENMKIVRKEKWNAKVAPKASAHRTRTIGYFKDGQLVKTYPSSRKAAADLYCSYQTILDICNHKYKREPLVDVRYI